MSNLDLFYYSGEHPEPIFDSYYKREKVVIPRVSEETNLLVRRNARLIELISLFDHFQGENRGKDDPKVVETVNEIVSILATTDGINLSAFSQFFMVYNSSHSSFMNYPAQTRFDFVYEMLGHYVRERHAMYLSHGYTNSILQVVCDNYSHKRNSKTSIVKVCEILEGRGFSHALGKMPSSGNYYYLLPDKGDEVAFTAFKTKFSVEMESAKTEQNKLPDMLFHLNGHFYVVEMKSMKGCGGGQDKQLTEVINFIRYAEKDARIHYVTFLDGEYSNLLHGGVTQPKIRCQYDDAVSCLKSNPGNYFLNTAGFQKFLDVICGKGVD